MPWARHAPKSNPKINPKIGAPHTARQNRTQKAHHAPKSAPKSAHQNRCTAHQNRPKIGAPHTAHQNRARKGAPRTKFHPKGHHAPGPRPHIRQVSGSIPPRPSPILVDLVARSLAVPCCCGCLCYHYTGSNGISSWSQI